MSNTTPASSCVLQTCTNCAHVLKLCTSRSCQRTTSCWPSCTPHWLISMNSSSDGDPFNGLKPCICEPQLRYVNFCVFKHCLWAPLCSITCKLVVHQPEQTRSTKKPSLLLSCFDQVPTCTFMKRVMNVGQCMNARRLPNQFITQLLHAHTTWKPSRHYVWAGALDFCYLHVCSKHAWQDTWLTFHVHAAVIVIDDAENGTRADNLEERLFELCSNRTTQHCTLPSRALLVA